MARTNKKIFRYLIPVFLIVVYVGYAALKVATAQEHTTEKQEQEHSAEEISAPHTDEVVHADEVTPHTDENHNESNKLDAGKLIMEHIADAHDWHIATLGHTHISIPLPVIIKDQNGIHCFSSSRFEHGHAAYQGYKLEDNKLVAVNEDGSVDEHASFYDLSITKNVASMFMAVAILFLLVFSTVRQYRKNGKKAPRGIASLIEMMVVFIRDDVAKPSIGPKYEKFMPFLLTIFSFILINNAFGLIPFFPGGANVTGNIAVTMVLAIFTFVITSFNGNKSYWGHIFLPPGVPKVLWILLVPIEIIGMFNKPIVLMIRLFANITAGHIIILGFFSLIFIFGAMNSALGLGVSVFSVAFTTFMNFLELLVAFLQAYVFTLLSSLYFGAAVEEHHHAEDHH
ncbi:MAG: F0F1 ATP synthase subunit A [Bacteroidia bacterium]|jgi:F-type H+-transporting ATPase subunit a